jgi:hypothetical protein
MRIVAKAASDIQPRAVMHLVVHFEIARLKGKEWRVIAIQSTDSSKKNALNQVFAQLY